ncbi:MAG: hypothetical protein K2W95_33585 [Candidatus Obscuribacterales bacterium]|nr:hypothetical protein [Candidatus Obscuribacterales bacterium]
MKHLTANLPLCCNAGAADDYLDLADARAWLNSGDVTAHLSPAQAKNLAQKLPGLSSVPVVEPDGDWVPRDGDQLLWWIPGNGPRQEEVLALYQIDIRGAIQQLRRHSERAAEVLERLSCCPTGKSAG